MLLISLYSNACTRRLVAVLGISIVFLFVLRAVLFVVFLLAAPNSSSPPVPVLNSRSVAQTSAVIAQPLSPGLVVQVTSAGSANEGISNVTVVLSAGLANPDHVWQDWFGFSGTVFDYAGVPLGAVYTLPGLVPRSTWPRATLYLASCHALPGLVPRSTWPRATLPRGAATRWRLYNH